MSETVTMSRDALVELLTTAALIGRSEADKISTRGDARHELAAYGLVGGVRLDRAITTAERNVSR